MEFPAEIRNKINELTESADIRQLKTAAARLSENYRSENNKGKQGAVSDNSTLAYAAVRMPATFAAVSRALELSLADFGGEINSILDVGAGTGAGAIAAARLTECENVTCIEREKNMHKLGQMFCECSGVPAKWIQSDINSGITEHADLVICSYCLNELPEKSRKTAISELIRSADKLLIIVEPGTPFSFECMKQIRSTLIEKGLNIAAPCPHTSECELPQNDWCHFTARAQRTKLHKLLKNADVPYEDEKFCFLAAAKENCLPCSARILRKPLIQSGKITLSLCRENSITTETITKKNPLFKTARKSECGGEFPTNKEEVIL